jgi:hypothetical protein
MKIVGLTQQSMASGAVDERADQIHAQTSALLALSSTGGTLTATGGEDTLYLDNEPQGCWRPVTAIVDLDNMVFGDTIVLRVYYRIRDAGGLQLWDMQTFTGIDGSLANGAKLVDISLEPNRHGFQLTLQQTAGTNRNYDWELFAEA